jgi:hypothetical protein
MEDAAVAEDPLLNVRLGLPLRRPKRGAVALRRSAKAVGRCVARRAVWVAVMAGLLVLALALLLTHSLAVALLVLLPSAFALGLAVPRSPRVRATSDSIERARRVRTHPPSSVE